MLVILPFPRMAWWTLTIYGIFEYVSQIKGVPNPLPEGASRPA